jgi:hypothetical protein
MIRSSEICGTTFRNGSFTANECQTTCTPSITPTITPGTGRSPTITPGPAPLNLQGNTYYSSFDTIIFTSINSGTFRFIGSSRPDESFTYSVSGNIINIGTSYQYRTNDNFQTFTGGSTGLNAQQIFYSKNRPPTQPPISSPTQPPISSPTQLSGPFTTIPVPSVYQTNIMSVAPFNLRFDTASTGRRVTRTSSINFEYIINNHLLTIWWTDPIGTIITKRYAVNGAFTRLVTYFDMSSMTFDHNPVDTLDKQP